MCRVAVACLLSVLAAACASHDEVARSASPDRAVDAVVVEGNGGATTSFWYDVYITMPGADYASGQFVASLYGAVRNANAYGVTLRWMSPTLLHVQYLSAKSAILKRSQVTLNGRLLTVALSSGVQDATAPSGGMLYNKGRQ